MIISKISDSSLWWHIFLDLTSHRSKWCCLCDVFGFSLVFKVNHQYLFCQSYLFTCKASKDRKKPVFIHKRIEEIVCCSLAPPALSDGQGLSSVGYRLSEMKILESITLSFTELICSYFIVSLIRVRSYH